jgi:hypothetical protein
MDADFAIELGRDDPALDFPWKDPAGKLAYVDLRRHPERVGLIEEARRFPELAEFLCGANSERSGVETAKCDAWESGELSAEEEIYDAAYKFVSYVDLIFSDIELRRFPFDQALSVHEQFARKLVDFLRRAAEMPAAAEILVRRCYFDEDGSIREGLYLSLYVSGYGSDLTEARLHWASGLKVVGDAVASGRAVTG